MKHLRTQTFEMVNEVLDMAKIAVILFWMPMVVLAFLGFFLSFE